MIEKSTDEGVWLTGGPCVHRGDKMWAEKAGQLSSGAQARAGGWKEGGLRGPWASAGQTRWVLGSLI